MAEVELKIQLKNSLVFGMNFTCIAVCDFSANEIFIQFVSYLLTPSDILYRIADCQFNVLKFLIESEIYVDIENFFSLYY